MLACRYTHCIYKSGRLFTAGKADQPKYHVVAPSLPGYGFSSAPVDPGFGLEQMAATLNELMIQLGYSKYVAQGEALTEAKPRP